MESDVKTWYANVKKTKQWMDYFATKGLAAQEGV